MAKRRNIRPGCPDCGCTMVRFNPSNIDHVLAMAPESQWRQIMSSPDLLMLAVVALNANDARALAATLQLAGMRMRARRSS